MQPANIRAISVNPEKRQRILYIFIRYKPKKVPQDQIIEININLSGQINEILWFKRKNDITTEKIAINISQSTNCKILKNLFFIKIYL
jgi:hypothetical protein